MARHEFGGNWTEIKLESLNKYLTTYRKIFTSNPKASYFKTWYVDAFAGTGSRSVSDPATSSWVTQNPLFEDVYDDAEVAGYQEGSATIALKLQQPFDYYLFIDKSESRLNTLRNTVTRDYQHLLQRCNFRQGDANNLLDKWCKERNWSQERAVVFLDPYGMQVEWDTIETLAGTKGIDMWYLFPLGVGVARLLRRNGNIDETWQHRLTLLFGTPDWRTRFYQVQRQEDLFGVKEIITRDASVERIATFIQERLSTCFAKVAKGLVLRNSKSNPLYLLCFAAANERGSTTALKIAQYIIDAKK